MFEVPGLDNTSTRIINDTTLSNSLKVCIGSQLKIVLKNSLFVKSSVGFDSNDTFFTTGF